MWPAGDPSVRARFVALPAGNRVRIVEAGSPNGRAVLLVHGWGACAYSFDAMMPALASAGCRAIAIDLPGLGLSDKPTSRHTYTTGAMSGAVVDVAQQLGLERFTLVGHSMGGAIGLRLAMEAERRLEKLVLLNAVGLGRAPLMGPVRVLSPKPLEPIIAAVFGRATIRWILRLAYGTTERPTGRDVDQYWAPTQFPGMLSACRLLAHHFDFEPVPDAALHSIRVPVLAVASRRDWLVRGAAERASLIPASRIVTVHGGHLALQECAATVNAAVLDFLAN